MKTFSTVLQVLRTPFPLSRDLPRARFLSLPRSLCVARKGTLLCCILHTH
jgi:hypothetical protein